MIRGRLYRIRFNFNRVEKFGYPVWAAIGSVENIQISHHTLNSPTAEGPKPVYPQLLNSSTMYLLIKRFFDILFSLIALAIISPVLIPVTIILLLTGEHEVFYKQERVGYKNRIFGILKFATMLKNSPNMGSKDLTSRNDPRVLPIGKFLRKSKLNELPQLINIMIGDMSFVGPRPLMKSGYDRYSDEMKEKVYNVRPGLTGIGSIVFRDEELIITNSKLSPEE